jgi:esterase/lipase
MQSWLKELSCKATGTPILCIHGLNQQPMALRPLLLDLEKQDNKAYLLVLPGHEVADQRPMDRESHEQSIINAHNYIVNKHGQTPNLLGYSYGGLLGAYFASELKFNKLVFLAPALKLRSYTLAIQPFLKILPKVPSIPLGNTQLETYYRFHTRGVPSQIYQSFFYFYTRMIEADKTYLKDYSALVYAHPKDELIDSLGLEAWVKKHTQWSFTQLDNSKAQFTRYNHLCFDSRTLGESVYNRMLSQIQAHLT